MSIDEGKGSIERGIAKRVDENSDDLGNRERLDEEEWPRIIWTHAILNPQTKWSLSSLSLRDK